MKEILQEYYKKMKGKEINFVYQGDNYKIKKGRRAVVIYKNNEKFIFHKSMKWSWKLLFDQYLNDDIDSEKF